jgi:hypothetical protein
MSSAGPSTESLGEMERKRSYRRDTTVLALPGQAKGCELKLEKREEMGKGMDALRSKRRATGRVMPFSQRRYAGYSRPEVRKRAIGSVTGIG